MANTGRRLAYYWYDTCRSPIRPERAIHAAIQSATHHRAIFPSILIETPTIIEWKIVSIAKQHWVWANVFPMTTQDNCRWFLNGFKDNIADAKSSNCVCTLMTGWRKKRVNYDELRLPREWGRTKRDRCKIGPKIARSDPIFYSNWKIVWERRSASWKSIELNEFKNIRMWKPLCISSVRELKKELAHLPQFTDWDGTVSWNKNDSHLVKFYNGEYGFLIWHLVPAANGVIGSYFAQNASPIPAAIYAYKISRRQNDRSSWLKYWQERCYNCPSDPSLRRPPKKNESESWLIVQ